MQGKPRKRNKGPSTSIKHKRKRTKKHKLKDNIPRPFPLPPEPTNDVCIPTALPGQLFHMHFGFVCGSTYTIKQEDGHSYLIIVDRATRYTSIFLTKNKKPPTNIVRKFLRKFESHNPHRAVRTDLGREPGQSGEFRKILDKEGFRLETTNAEDSVQTEL